MFGDLLGVRQRGCSLSYHEEWEENGISADIKVLTQVTVTKTVMNTLLLGGTGRRFCQKCKNTSQTYFLPLKVKDRQNSFRKGLQNLKEPLWFGWSMIGREWHLINVYLKVYWEDKARLKILCLDRRHWHSGGQGFKVSIFSHIQMSPKSSRIFLVLCWQWKAEQLHAQGKGRDREENLGGAPAAVHCRYPWQSFAPRAEEPELKVKPAQLRVSKTSRTGLQGFWLLIPNFD